METLYRNPSTVGLLCGVLGESIWPDEINQQDMLMCERLMANPFVAKALSHTFSIPARSTLMPSDGSVRANVLDCTIQRHPRSGSVITDNHLRVRVDTTGDEGQQRTAIIRNVFAIGDCAACADREYPATAQVASQQATWLAKHLNQGDVDAVKNGFSFENLGIMAYLGAFNGIVQLGKGRSISGRAAFWMWRSVYLTKSISWRNRFLIPIYW